MELCMAATFWNAAGPVDRRNDDRNGHAAMWGELPACPSNNRKLKACATLPGGQMTADLKRRKM